MGSVIEHIECPNCKLEASLDFYYKTGEEFVVCTNCGYHKSTYIDRSDDYEDVSEPKWVTEELKNPYGLYRLKYKSDAFTKLGSLENEQHWTDFVSEVMTDTQDIEYFTLNRLVDNKIETTTII